MKTYYVKDLNKGEEVTDFFIAKRAEIKTGVNGKKYFDILLGDKTGEISGKKWDVDGVEEQALSRYNAGDIVKVKALVNEWDGSPQFRVMKIRPLSDSDVIDPTDYVKAAPESSIEMYNYLSDKANSLEDEDFKTISVTILERNKEKLLYYPAAKMNHHAVFGGLLFHLKRMLMLAEHLCEVYTTLSRDLLITGVIIHDIEKINEMSSDTSGVVSEYTFEGQMLGHLVMGVRTIDRLMDELGFSEEKAVLLEHMMISHHYEPEFGSPRKPLFPEAEALHYLDMLDSKLYDFDDNLAAVTPGRFSEWIRTLDGRRLYKASSDIKKYEEKPAAMAELKCTVERIVYRNDENGFTVASVTSGRQKTRAVGIMPDICRGFSLVLNGELEINGRFGEQFTVRDYEVAVRTDEQSFEDFLGSGIISGIGPKTAAAIVRKFGAETFDVIENDPEKLKQIPGIGDKKLAAILVSYKEHKETTDTVLHFVRLGISRAAAMRLYKNYGTEAPAIVNEDPYRLVREVDGIDFHTADLIARKLGFSANGEERIGAGIIYILSRAALEGNTCLPAGDALEKTRMLLDVMGEEIEEAALYQELGGNIKREKLLGGGEFWFLSSLYLAEKSVANNLHRLRTADLVPVRADIQGLIEGMEKSKDIVLSSEQKKAVETSLVNGVFVITGGPGTGKTTIIQAVADVLTSCGFILAIAAPTGRAAKRITEATGYEAKTIHRLLEYSSDPDGEKLFFGRDSMNPLEIDAIIVDEASMIDVILMAALLDALPSGVRLIIVGDADQLPPVGAGNVLKDIIASDRIDYAMLTEIYRQAGESLIVTNAHCINRGEMPVINLQDGNFFLYKQSDEISACRVIKELCAERLPGFMGIESKSALLDIQVVTPVKSRRLGTFNLNEELQAVLNPPAAGKSERPHGRRIFREGDKVMQMKNDYGLSWIDTETLEKGEGVFNGDIGFVNNINEDEDIVSVIYDGTRLVRYDADGLENLELAYAITVHKSQGSEYPCVIMPVMFVPPALATRNLLYTAVTRGKDLVVLVGSEDRLRLMVENAGTDRRCSALDEFLRAQ